MNALLERVAVTASENLRASIGEADAEIMSAWQEVVAQCQEEEKSPVLTLSFSIKLNLDASTMTTALAFSVRRRYEISGTIPDPNQTELPIVLDQREGTAP